MCVHHIPEFLRNVFVAGFCGEHCVE